MSLSAALLLWATIAGCPDTLPPRGIDSLRVLAFRAESPPPMDALTSYWRNFRVDSGDLSRILATFVVVSNEEWLHGYSHVGGGDRRGWARLGNGGTVDWLIRPGGLARLQYSDGPAVYLVSCRTNLYVPSESDAAEPDGH